MSESLASLLGERERVFPVSPEAWRAVEGWVGRALPEDYKNLVDGYGDAVLFGHLFVPHPGGSDPLLNFMQEERRYFHAAYQDVSDIPASLKSKWDDVVPWAYHDWNGDVCLLVPGDTAGLWNVAVAFRQNPGFLIVDGGVEDFFQLILREEKFPRGWPVGQSGWESIPDSPLV
ncbi:SMI1/KNR4 family protein [Streptomyces bobili]|uniref:SMI1/KNR4 family protein n=1 Tax=Streptomyces bobili TaxID=67280 RepID=UPI002251B40A|nr:SMI1/KNR4 family protein [Streptomyces bobili]MCX5526628.1 SMI1/KNR4 family protein [Streptomyces bobili]